MDDRAGADSDCIDGIEVAEESAVAASAGGPNTVLARRWKGEMVVKNGPLLTLEVAEVIAVGKKKVTNTGNNRKEKKRKQRRSGRTKR